MAILEYYAAVKDAFISRKFDEKMVLSLGFNRVTVNRWKAEPVKISTPNIVADLEAGVSQKAIEKKYGLPSRFITHWLRERPEVKTLILSNRNKAIYTMWKKRLQSYFAGKKTQTDIARKYGVAPATVYKWTEEIIFNQTSKMITAKQIEKIKSLSAAPLLKVSIGSIIKDITGGSAATIDELTEQEAKDVICVLKRLIK